MPKPDSFNEGTETFTNYKERLDVFFIANDIPASKHSATLLSSIGAQAYNTVRSLTAPVLPSTKSYDELCSLLSSHFCPPPLEIVERFKFHKRDQGVDESLSEFLASIKQLSEHCNFGENLKNSLRDRFVCGLKDEAIQKRLLQEPNITLESATSLAFAMETAQRDATEIHNSTAAIHKMRAAQPSRKSQTTSSYPPCQSCGKTNHRRADCYLREAICKRCKKQGHIQTVCKTNSNNGQSRYTKTRPEKVHEVDQYLEEEEESFTLELFRLTGKTPKITVDLEIDGIETQMELDTGSAVSVMTQDDYVKIFNKEPKLEKTNIRLKTYTEEVIHPLGRVQVDVAVNNQKRKLPLVILERGSNPLFGRDWLSELKLDWQSIHKITQQNSKVNNTKPELVEKLRSEFEEVFSDGIGKVKELKGILHVKEDAVPKFCKARSMPYAFKSKVERELDHLEDQGIITKIASSQWATPIVPVIKPNGDVRICGDFKVTVNPALNIEQYTMPKMEDMMATLEQGKSYSKIDLRQAYLQLPLDEASRIVTTINTSKGLYTYNRLPFGIASSPAIWQRTMDTILQGIPGVQCNQDDMIITGKTEDEHYKNLHSVLTKLKEYGLKANLEKCKFFQDEVIFCGIKITHEGLHKTDEKIRAILDAPSPKTKSQLRSFLGMVNYYHKWLHNIAPVAKPLYDQLQNHKTFNWTDDCNSAFQKIKELIASDKVLIKYDPELPLRLATDASPYGIGAVLSHVTKTGEERPIAYASRTLNKAEQNYSQLDKEALSITWGVKKFFNYVCGRSFTLVTDHQPLKYIFSPTRAIPAMSAARQQRYALFLSGFNYTIEYRNSKANANADGLSRLPLPVTCSQKETEAADDIFYNEIMDSLPVSATSVAKESRRDPLISKIIHFVETCNWPDDIDESIRPFFNKRNELVVQQNCLLWGYRLIPPETLRKKILNMLHEGHLGIVKMKNIARGYFWWPALDKEIESVTKSCSGCATSQPDPLKAPLHPWQWPEKPWQRIHVDYAGPLMNCMFLVVVDAHTKWAEIIPTSKATSTSTIHILSNLFSRFGLPEHIVSDNGAQFTSNEFNAFVKSNGVKHTFSAPYHPATNGLAERMVKTFKQAMKAAKSDKGTMHIKLARFLFAYRNAPHMTTNESPASLMFGRRLRTHLDIVRPDINSKVKLNQTRQGINHSQANLREFHTGDTVLVRDYRGHQQWQHGTIHSQTGSRTYMVNVAPGTNWRRHSDQIVHTLTPPSVNKATPVPAYPFWPHQTPTTNIQGERESQPAQTSGDREHSPARSQVVPPRDTPTLDELPNSSIPSVDPRSQRLQTDIRSTHTTRSGRVVRKPTKYTE